MSTLGRKCLTLALLCVFVNAYSQQSLDEIVVSTTKIPQKESGLSKSMIVLSDSVIRANAALGLSQILQKQAGLNIIGAGQPLGSIQNVYMRGANSGYTLILLDGVPIYDPSSTENNFDLNLINMQNIERIEILKGGQSTLYGSDAVAGVINLISKKAANKPIDLNAKLMYGTYNTLEGQVGASGQVGGIAYSASLGHIASDGFSSVVSQLESPEKDGFKRTNWSAQLSKQLGKTKLTAFGRQSVYNTDLDEGIFVDDKDYTFESKNFQTGILADYVGEKAQVHLKTNWSDIHRVFENDSTYIPPAAYSNYSYSTFGSTAAFADLFGQFSFGKNVQWLIGTDYRNQAMEQTYLSVSSYGPYEDVPLEKKDTRIENFSVYSALSMLSNVGLGIELSGRVNHHSVYDYNTSWNLNPYYKLSDSFTAFVNFGTSFKNPTLYQLYSPYGNEELSPEQAQNLDFGFRSRFFKKNQFNVSVFNRKVEEGIFFQNLTEAPYGRYINQDKKRVKGLEASLTQGVGPVNVRANYTFMQGYIFNAGDSEEKSDLIRRPKHQWDVGASTLLFNKLGVSIDMEFVGKRQDLFYNSETFGNESVELKAYTLLGLNLDYRIAKQLKAFVNIQNLADVDYTEVYGYNSQGRNVRLGLIWQ
ncbi:TonB-dependent receptor [Marinilongibacter aquaticus]|uniref:TonB-dependent receptor plug domain-containing protein n=1 Tax=Marinilongibacter aquaticus TaxID=2975157 RepID=UPI0021BD3490|nr:TonB-dependent receptor [Marinilongibacter aquaticus]UBM60529.1 TonB-dependent receptor [Marinilongibacter aquaticus]